MSGCNFSFPQGADLARAVVEAFSDKAGLTKDELAGLGVVGKKADIVIDFFHNDDDDIGKITAFEKGILTKLFSRDFAEVVQNPNKYKYADGENLPPTTPSDERLRAIYECQSSSYPYQGITGCNDGTLQTRSAEDVKADLSQLYSTNIEDQEDFNSRMNILITQLRSADYRVDNNTVCDELGAFYIEELTSLISNTTYFKPDNWKGKLYDVASPYNVIFDSADNPLIATALEKLVKQYLTIYRAE